MASIADIYVTLLPETSRISEGIVSAFRKVDPEAREAGRRWGREIQQGLTGVDVELKADTAKAKTEIDEATRDRKTKTDVDADTAKAKEEIDEATRDRKTKVKLEVDPIDLRRLTSLIDSGQREQASALSGYLRASRDLSSGSFKDPLDHADAVLKMDNAGQKFAESMSGSLTSTLSAAMPAVGSALSTALIAGAVTAAAGVAGALSGAIGLIPAGLGGGVAVLGTLVTGLDGVKNAWDAAGKAADSATKDGAAKAKEVASAQKTLRDAVMDEATAQKDVANARKDARIQLEDLNVQLRGGVIDEKSAILDAQAARRDLATGRFKDSIEYQQAQLRVQQADQRVLESHERNVNLQNKATDANAKGVDQSDQVVAANQRLAKAHDDVATAQNNLATTQTKPSSEAEALAIAMGKLSPTAQAFIGTLTALKPAWQSLKFSVQDSLFAGIGPQIQSLTTQYLPTLKTAMSGLAGTMNSAFKDVGAWLSKPETMATIQQIVANIGSSFQQWAQSIVPFSQAFLTITQVGSSFLPGLGKMISDGATAFNNFIQSATRTGELQHWMQLGIDTVRELMNLVPVLGKLFMDLAPMAIPALQLIGQFVRAIEPAIQPIVGVLATMTAALAQHPGLIQAVVVAFGTWKAITVVSTVLTALEGISAALTAMPAEAATAGAGMTAALGPILGTLTTAATALALFNSHGSSADPNIGPGGDERKRKLDAGKAYADAHGGKVPDGYQQWLDSKGPMPKDLNPYYAQGAAPGTPFYDAQGRPLNAQGKPFSGATSLPGPYVPNMPLSTVPGALATAPAATSGYNWDALAQAEAGGNWANKSNPKYMGGLQFDQQTWNAYKSPDAPPNAADASKDQQIAAGNNAIAAGRTPQSLWPQNYQKLGSGAAAVPGITTSSTPSSVPSAGAGAAAPSMPTIGTPSALPGLGGAPPSILHDEGGLHSQAAATNAAGILAQMFPQLTTIGGAHPDSMPYHPEGRALDVMIPGGSTMNGANPQGKALGDQIKAWALQNAQALGLEDTIWQDFWQPPGGAGNSLGRASQGPTQGHFDHVHLTFKKGAVPDPNSMYPSAAGMPTVASPQGVSPDGTPLGTQQSPMYVQSAQGGSGQQLGQDFISGIGEMFGFDGSLFKNPLDTGLFKGFKGFMSFLTGGMGRGQGSPASAFQGGGGMPGMSGGGDLFGGVGSMLTGLTQQPFGQNRVGGPMQAPDEYQPMLPGSGGSTGMPSNFLAPGKGETPTGGGHKVDQSINFFGPVGNPVAAGDMATSLNVPRARQGLTGLPR